MKRFIFIIPVNADSGTNDREELKSLLKNVCNQSEKKCHWKLFEDLCRFSSCSDDEYINVAFVPDCLPGAADMCEWASFDSSMNAFDATWEQLWNKDFVKDKNYTWMLADTVHAFADQLPVIGSCFVDVIINMTGSVVKLDDNIELFGALARLHYWHNAMIRVNCSDSSKDQLNDWKDMLYVCDNDVQPGIELWRGYISLGEQVFAGPFLPHFSLVAPFHENCNCESQLKSANCNKIGGKSTSSRRYSKYYRDLTEVLRHDLLLIGEYDKSTVPSYMLSPRRFYLKLLCTSESTKHAQEFLSHVIANIHMCYLFRLGYKRGAHISEKFTAEEWKQSDAMHCVPNLEKYLKGSTFLHFFVYYQDSKFVAQLLYLPESFDPSFFVSPNCSEHAANRSEVGGDDDVTEILRNSPCIPSNLFNDINDIVLEAQQKALDILERSHEESGIKGQSSKEETVSPLMEMVQETLLKKLIEDNIIPAKADFKNSCRPNSLPCFEYQKDQNDWPERKALLQESINCCALKQSSSLVTLSGMDPPALDSLTISLDAKELSKNFKQSGEAKKEVIVNSSKLSSLGRKKNGSTCPNQAPDSEVTILKWPQMLQTQCHGTYYNVDASSEKDQVKCDKLKSRYLLDETGSTCSSVENKHSKCIKVPKKSTLTLNLSHQQTVRRSPRKHRHSLPNFLSAPLTSASHPSSSRNKAHIQKKSVSSSASTLSDTHRMKLRCCVVDELEKYGITLQHPAFKDCGKKLFAICRPFVKDLIGARSITAEMRKICQSHVKQVIDFEMEKVKRLSKGRRSL